MQKKLPLFLPISIYLYTLLKCNHSSTQHSSNDNIGVRLSFKGETSFPQYGGPELSQDITRLCQQRLFHIVFFKETQLIDDSSLFTSNNYDCFHLK